MTSCLILERRRAISNQKSGDDSEEDPPVPMPNTAVKLFSAHGSWGFPLQE